MTLLACVLLVASAPASEDARFETFAQKYVQELLDRQPETATRLGQAYAHTVARKPAAHENDVAVDASDPLAAEREVVDRELERLAATRFCHGYGHYKGRSESSQFGRHFGV